MTRIGIKERHILKEEGEGTSFMGTKAVNELLLKTNTKPEEVDMLICATVTPDHPFPATANIIADKVGIKGGFHYDLNAGCSGFLYALATGSRFIESGQYKKIIILGADKMSSIVDYTDRSVSPIFGDGAGAVMLEPTTDGIGVIDMMLESDGVGRHYLHQKAGGSVKPATHESIDAREHFVYQEGQPVFKWAVSKMADTSVAMMEKHNLTSDDIKYLVPHQANMRIITATAKRMGLDPEKVMINIEKYGNTTAATLPLCLADYEDKLKRGDNLILSTFGAGFTWGSIYVKWAIDPK
jgi:3-oxoacyl-[acyl-carrier-protein] synthase-3